MTFRPTIRTQQDLEEAWRTLMGPLGFAGHSIWLMLIRSDDRPFPHLTQIEDAEHLPTPVELAGAAEMLEELHAEFAPGGRAAFLRSRPGSGGLTPDDRAWAEALYEVARIAGVPTEVVHRACDVDLVPVPMDDALPDSVA
ncbi:hypothetical protein [Nocardioides sp.]|uniref:hypothetical protein n=1 Tax=Nocardioides sp. TaxID=35761 RepID=UPI002ED57E00